MKKIIGLVVALFAVITFIKPAQAEAAAISSAEQKIVHQLKKPVIISERSFFLKKEYVTQTENYLKSHDLTKAQSKAVLRDIQGVVTILEESNADVSDIKANDFVTLATRLSDSDIASIKDLIQHAASTIGLTVSSWNHGDINFADAKTGAVVFTSGGAVKQTGSNYGLSILVLVALLASAAGAFAFSKKAKLA